MRRSRIIVFAILLISLVSVASADLAIVAPFEQEVHEEGLMIAAHGDAWIYSASNAPSEATKGWLWLFGYDDSIYGLQFPVNNGDYTIRIPKETVWSLTPGLYNFYLQFPGTNAIREINYNSKGELGSPWRNVENISVKGFEPRIVKERLDQFIASNKYSDDIWYKNNRVRIEEPNLHVEEMYETSKGNLRLAGITNLVAGDIITAIVDEDIVHGTYKELLFTQTTNVTGDDPTQYRTWSMDIQQSNIGELSPGRHFVFIHLPTGESGSLGFDVIERVIEPTPTPEIIRSYGITGSLIGIDTKSQYNYSEAHPTNVAPTQTPRPSTTEAMPAKLSNRTITQGMSVYIGETDLDIWPVLGWQNQSNGGWFIAYWKYGQDFYELPNKILSIDNPQNFNINEEFVGFEGEWFQWAGWYEPKTPVAFVVKKLPANYNTSVVAITTTQTIQPTITAAPVVAVTTTIPTTQPTRVPTTLAVNVPVAGWIGIAAIGIAILRKGK